MIKAFVLIKTEIGKVDQIFDKLKNIKGVVSVASTAGKFDIILIAKVKNLERLSELVTNKIHKIPGITSTITHVIAKEEKNA
jgi:DNA-binding Lrp family transcriptional regulator